MPRHCIFYSYNIDKLFGNNCNGQQIMSMSMNVQVGERLQMTLTATRFVYKSRIKERIEVRRHNRKEKEKKDKKS